MNFDTYVRQLKTLCSRRDSAAVAQKTSAQVGFTLVELIVTVSIVGIFAAIAVPSFGNLIRRQNVNSAANELYDMLQYARGEAVTQSRKISIQPTGSGSTPWSSGNITVTIPAIVGGADAVILRQTGSGGLAQGVSIATGASALTFSMTGNSSAAACFRLKSATDSTIPTQFIGVQASGRITPPSKTAPASGECN